MVKKKEINIGVLMSIGVKFFIGFMLYFFYIFCIFL